MISVERIFYLVRNCVELRYAIIICSCRFMALNEGTKVVGTLWVKGISRDETIKLKCFVRYINEGNNRGKVENQ